MTMAITNKADAAIQHVKEVIEAQASKLDTAEYLDFCVELEEEMETRRAAAEES